MITEKEFKERIAKEKKQSIYGYMYGNQYCNCSDGKFADTIIEINLNDCEFGTAGLIYIWGWPGPDYNIYRFEDYGKTWALSVKEIEPNPYPTRT